MLLLRRAPQGADPPRRREPRAGRGRGRPAPAPGRDRRCRGAGRRRPSARRCWPTSSCRPEAPSTRRARGLLRRAARGLQGSPLHEAAPQPFPRTPSAGPEVAAAGDGGHRTDGAGTARRHDRRRALLPARRRAARALSLGRRVARGGDRRRARPDRAREPVRERVRHARRRRCARPRAPRRAGAARRGPRAPRRAARHPDPDQGPHADGGCADDVRLPRVPRPTCPARTRSAGPDEGGRRHPDRQDDHAGVRHDGRNRRRPDRRDQQPLGPGPDGGWLDGGWRRASSPGWGISPGAATAAARSASRPPVRRRRPEGFDRADPRLRRQRAFETAAAFGPITARSPTPR